MLALTSDTSRLLPDAPPPVVHDRVWPETNCFVDLLTTLVAARGLEPRAGLGFTVRQDFEGDHFTFFKQPAADLERLYGLVLQETALWESLEAHALVQAAHGRTMLVEVDSFFLPDTAATDHRRAHGKTTIGILALDPASRRLDYIHNTGIHALSGEDYDGLFRPAAAPGALLPYAETVKAVGPALEGDALFEAAVVLLAEHLRRRPTGNPVLAFKAAFAARAENLVRQDLGVFHRYAFNTSRQLGANFEQLALHLDWLGEAGLRGTRPFADAARGLSSGAKAFQFQLARGFGRRTAAGLADRLDPLAAQYDAVLGGLVRRFV